MANDWWGYITRHAGERLTQKQIAEVSGVDQSTISRWKREGANKPENIIKFARAFRRPPVEALIAAGYLTENEAADVVTIRPVAADLTDDALLDEVRRRMTGGSNAVEDDEEQGAPSQAVKSQKTSDDAEDRATDAVRNIGEAPEQSEEVL
ncbi:helix-turn-helix transcriptional regulator [Gordonia sp. N1V]|uniref:helix-turn-helix domain-containing protein n=1 Tax=Gordonia sp. N1V TaxID=3034163 RepID=UPI0023E2D173|nr:helix-turn-helix transcriptional regulator [Gordonia sp. N1V]MDF3280442.1 helix-turn-helix transcriptional regulator [Gordonia sp. N1V]